jgi:hypothetical protein
MATFRCDACGAEGYELVERGGERLAAAARASGLLLWDDELSCWCIMMGASP